MAGQYMSALSTDYDQWAIKSSANPTADVVQFAYMASGAGDPGPTDWFAGSWVLTPLSTGEWVARALIGPGAGGKVLARGSYTVWVKITDNPTIPVVSVGTLTIT